MEDSFKVRVDRAFGSLESTSSSLSSLWCLTDQEIERNEWIKDKVTPYKHKDEVKNPKPYSSFLQPSTSHQDLESDIQELDDDQQPLSSHSNEEWNIRSSLGMDCTLDNEEEEDGFDKVALGKEERFYMRDVNDYEVEIDSNNELPNAFTDVMRDPRANRMAAKLRLKEDDESAKKSIQREDEITRQDVVMDQVLPSVPDYERNPWKYTHYTFDSMDDVDEESNKKAYMELFNSLKGWSGTGRDDVSPTSIIFTPRKKSSDDGSMNKNKVDMQQQQKKKKEVVRVTSIDEDEVCVMEEDEPSNKSKGGRRYRTKGAVVGDDTCVS
ncbi:uncharacterized protein LOC112504012 isoform X2 [Cynara cardunculus var. scolymus]|uniref:U5 small nuclear ribonucleoprotein TSSC4 n=1 Tax=Cynara cardunculus var. scolymus TaxID=59895 RepID=A0A118JCS2_CYNCS|nr:uncharacterized protein LOC112504012 isoform X2 [Cynara cardunculus var. scolymus]KVH65607.1 hypothetical protein Ccrd_025635 [Cynara cardunculus var. scolymus]